MKEYVYFVSYSYGNGFGMIEVKRNTPIETYDDVLSLRQIIKEHNALDVIILNWKKLKS